MQTTGIREGDIVKCDVRGQTFYALVTEESHIDSMTKRRVLSIQPLPGSHVSTYSVTPQQIVDHWRKKRTRSKKGSG
jgi:hypothetical protein